MGSNNSILEILIGVQPNWNFLSYKYNYYEEEIINLDLESKLIKWMHILGFKANLVNWFDELKCVENYFKFKSKFYFGEISVIQMCGYL